MLTPPANKRQRPLQDRYFDGLAERFHRQIYQSFKGRLRLALLQRDFDQHLPALTQHIEPMRILDVGGGGGQFCARLAGRAKHHITFCEPAKEMLTLAKKEFLEQAPGAQIHFLQAPLQQLPEHLSGPQDVVLFHAVIEWLADPIGALQLLGEQIKPGGWFSVLFYNEQALRWRHLMNGNWEKAQSDNLLGRKNRLTPINPQSIEQIQNALIDQGFEIKACTGMRSIIDNMKPYELAKKSFREVFETEAYFSQQDPYRQFARYIHLLARKPAHTYPDQSSFISQTKFA